MKKSTIILSVLLLAAIARAQWTEPVRISEPGPCWYPQILAQGFDIHVVYSNWDSQDKVSYVKSTDSGDFWSERIVLSDTVNTSGTMIPHIHEFNNRLIVLWRNTLSTGIRRKNIGYSLSENNGETWLGPFYVLDINLEHILYFSSAGSDTIINIIYNSRPGQDLVFYNVKSTDFGITWSDPVELFQSAQNGTMDMTAHGDYFHFVWSGNFDENETWETYYIKSTDGGAIWSDNIALVDLDGEASFWPSIATNNLGHLTFCWMDHKYSTNWFFGDVFMKRSFDNGEYWTAEQQVTFNHLAKRVDVSTNSDSINVIWEDHRFPRRTIYAINSTDGGASWNDEVRLENDTSESRNPAVAGSNNRIYAVWADDRCTPDTDICGGIYFTGYEDETGVTNGSIMLENIAILRSYPNPFNSKTILTYKNLKGGEIEIYNITGQKIRTLKTAEIKEGQIEWDARDALGNKVSSGNYFARARGGDNNATIKLLYLR